jgi:repressor LexA
MGRLIKRERLARNLTQVALAKRAGITQEWLCRIEGGYRNAAVPTLLRLSKAMGLSVDYLLGVKNNHKPKRK